MAAQYPITGNIADYLGDADPRKVRAVANLNIDAGQVVIDTTSNEIHSRSVNIVIAADGSFAPNLLATNATDLNVEPNTLRWTIVLSTVDQDARMRNRIRNLSDLQREANLGPFSVTGAATLASKAEEFDSPAISPSWRSAFIGEVETLADAKIAQTEAVRVATVVERTAAQTARTGAEVARTGAETAAASATAVALGDAADVLASAMVNDGPVKTNLTATSEAIVAARVAGTIPSPLLSATTTEINATTGVWPCDAIGEDFYGSRGGKIYKSTNGLAGWVEVCNTPAPNIVVGLRLMTDGEVVAVMATGVYKSSGWGTGTVTWTQKVVSNGLAAPQAFGIGGGDPANPGSPVCQKMIVTQYGPGSGQAWIDSRYAHVTIDAGDTWHIAFDSTIDTPGSAPADSHLHGGEYDAWADRFYVSEGHGAAGGIYHSVNGDPSPGDWALAPGMAIGKAGSASPTSITATDHGLVIGSDANSRQGVYGVVRAADPMLHELTYLWAWRAPRSGNNGWGAKGLRDPRTGIVYIAWKSQGAGLRPIITGGTPFGAALVWESPDTVVTADALEYMGITTSGRLAAFGNISGVNKVVTARLGRPAVTTRPDAGGVLGGTADDATSVSTGRGSTDQGLARSTATGVNAQGGQDATVTGYGAKANAASATVTGSAAEGSASDVVSGAGAIGTGGANVVLGAGATAAGSGVSVGRNAKSVATSIAVGYGSEALVGSDNVAIGYLTKTTGSKQIAVGPRHVEYTEVAAEPGIPAANQARVYLVDVGGETELRARFAGSANRIVRLASSVGTQGMTYDPVYPTANRPTAAAAGAGARYFDSTLGKPVWSNGTAWVDGTGAVV